MSRVSYRTNLKKTMPSIITIHSPVIQEFPTSARLVSVLEFDGRSVEMWYEVPKEYGHWFCADRADGFVVGFILQAMQMQKDIVTQAPMSSKLWHNLSHFFIPMMAAAFPTLHPIRINPASLIDEPSGGQGCATGFSGGIDSFASIVEHWHNEKSPGHKITHLLFHNAGSHSTGDHEAARRLFRQRYGTLKPFAEEAGIPFVPVDSNVSEIFPMDFIKMHPALNVSIPLVLQNHFQRYYYASTYKYADCGVNRTDDVARFDPLAFHLFSTEGLDCISTGGQMSRVEKTALVAGFEPSRRYLNVCVDPAFEGRNCSVCFKCLRTLLTLDLLGEIESYADVFDLGKYRAERNAYIRRLLRYKRASFDSEIANLIRERGTGRIKHAFKMRKLFDRMTGKS